MKKEFHTCEQSGITFESENENYTNGYKKGLSYLVDLNDRMTQLINLI